MFRRPEHSAGNRPFIDAGLRSGRNPYETPRHSSARGVFPYVDHSGQDRYALIERMRKKLRRPEPAETLRVRERAETDFSLGNRELPSYEKKAEIVEAVRNNQVTVIVGPTGSGKTTQVPQFLLDAGFDNISVTQPRILAANGVGDRIADELALSLGEEARELVAVQTSERFDHQEGAKIFVRTDGLEQVLQLERMLSQMPEDMACEMAANTVLIIDEVHESNVNQVGLLALTKRLLGKYDDLRVVVMSATADTEKYTSYFEDGGMRDVPIVEIEGKPADLKWLERPDVDAIQMIQELYVDGTKLEPGDDILLFTAGKNEIKKLIAQGIASGIKVEFVPLHAGMTSAEQARSVAPHPDTIRVIVSTDVAMTSLTFPHVK